MAMERMGSKEMERKLPLILNESIEHKNERENDTPNRKGNRTKKEAVDNEEERGPCLGHFIIRTEKKEDFQGNGEGEGEKSRGKEEMCASEFEDSCQIIHTKSPQLERARILKRLRKRRVGFEELCVTNFLSLFSVIEPHSNYFSLRKWANQFHSSDFLCNVFQENTSVTRSTRSTRLSPPGRKMYESPNAGGNSLWSEVMSLELLRGLYGANLVRTEMEILYGCHSKITDYSILLFGHHFGVSVTRAMKFQGIFCEEDAFTLLRKKLNGVIKSTRGVIREHRWEKQILHIWAECDYVVDVVRRAYVSLDDEYKANTLVLCTVARDCHSLF